MVCGECLCVVLCVVWCGVWYGVVCGMVCVWCGVCVCLFYFYTFRADMTLILIVPNISAQTLIELLNS